MGKRKASESPEKDEAAAAAAARPKLSKKKLLEQARERARLSMQSDRTKVETVKAKKNQSPTSDDEASPNVGHATKRRKVVDERVSKKKAREDAIQRAKEWGAKEKEQLEEKKTASSPTPPSKKGPKKGPTKGQAESKSASSVKKESATASKATTRTGRGESAPVPTMPTGLPAANPPQPSLTSSSQGQMGVHTMPPVAPVNPAVYNAGMNPALMAQYNMIRQQHAGVMSYGNPYMMAQQSYGREGGGGHFNAAYGPYYGSMPQSQMPQTQMNSPQEVLRQQQLYQQQQLWQDSIPNSATQGTATGSTTLQGNRGTAPSQPPTAVRSVSTSGRSVPTSVATAIPEDDDDDDEEDMPPPPVSTLEHQISQQVMANCAADMKNQPTPYNEPPPEAFENHEPEEEEEEHEVDEEPITMDVHVEGVDQGSKKKMTWSRSMVGAVIAGILSYFFVQEGVFYSVFPEQLSNQMETKPASDPLCFFDSVVVYDTEEVVPSCNKEDGVACPTWGVCEAGQIVGCSSTYYEVSDNKDGCVLTDESKDALSSLKKVLEEWSAKELCRSGSFETRPLFKYSELQLAKPTELASDRLDPNVLQTEFIVERREDGLYLGLSDEHNLKLPFSCGAGESIKKLLGSCGSLLMFVFHRLVSMAWSCFSAYPLISLVGLLLVLIVKRGRDYRAYRSKLVREIAQVRQMAYELLQEVSSESHVALHVRDDIAMTLYPESKSRREHLIKDVWPRVVPDFQQDNRIRKSTRMIEGKPRDVWQWVAVTSTKKKTATLRG